VPKIHGRNVGGGEGLILLPQEGLLLPILISYLSSLFPHFFDFLKT
jgi:hypothetical protein